MEIPAPERVEPRKTGHDLIDLVLSICALLISALSIFLAWYTGDSMDQLVQSNSWPALQLGSGNMTDERQPALSFSVTNAGIGPAQIYSLDFLVDGKSVSGRNGYLAANVAEACCPGEYRQALAGAGGDAVKALGTDLTRPVSRSFLSPGHETIGLVWPRTEANAAVWRSVDLARQEGRITLRACYCSVFDECWVAETHTFPPRKVDDCKPASVSRVK